MTTGLIRFNPEADLFRGRMDRLFNQMLNELPGPRRSPRMWRTAASCRRSTSARPPEQLTARRRAPGPRQGGRADHHREPGPDDLGRAQASRRRPRTRPATGSSAATAASRAPSRCRPISRSTRSRPSSTTACSTIMLPKVGGDQAAQGRRSAERDGLPSARRAPADEREPAGLPLFFCGRLLYHPPSMPHVAPRRVRSARPLRRLARCPQPASCSSRPAA